MALKRGLGVLALILGLLGLTACGAVGIGAWIGGARLAAATGNLFDKMDAAFVGIHERVAQTQARVSDLKITAEGIQQDLGHRVQQETMQQVAARMQIEAKSAQLAEALAKADQWLELAANSTELLQQVLLAGLPAGTAENSARGSRLLEELSVLRQGLAEAKEMTARLQPLTTPGGVETAIFQRRDEVAQVAIRLLATFGVLDSRLEQFQRRVAETQVEARHRETKIKRWIFLASTSIVLLSAWLAAGQFCLCRQGWQGMRRSVCVQEWK